jgi:hypothetical protein
VWSPNSWPFPSDIAVVFRLRRTARPWQRYDGSQMHRGVRRRGASGAIRRCPPNSPMPTSRGAAILRKGGSCPRRKFNQARQKATPARGSDRHLLCEPTARSAVRSSPYNSARRAGRNFVLRSHRHSRVRLVRAPDNARIVFWRPPRRCCRLCLVERALWSNGNLTPDGWTSAGANFCGSYPALSFNTVLVLTYPCRMLL